MFEKESISPEELEQPQLNSQSGWMNISGRKILKVSFVTRKWFTESL